MNPLVDAILRELDTRCEELEAAVRYYIRKGDRAAITTWYQLAEARGTRRVIRRLVDGVRAREAA